MELIGNLGEFLSGAQVRILYWFLALFGTVAFLAMLAFAMFGLGGDHDVDASGSSGDIPAPHADTGYFDFKVLSIRSILAFITFFGWGGVIWGKHGWAGFLVALACGFFMMFAMASLVFMLLKLQHSGNVSQNDYRGLPGKVYVGIPGGRANPGKVVVTLAGSTREVQAVADEEIPTGATIVIVEPLDGSKFLVRKS